jgi:hypothetical protein
MYLVSWHENNTATWDGGYVLAGGWASPNTGLVHPLLVKIDDNGTEQWTKSVWENHSQRALYECVVQSRDGGYVFGTLSPLLDNLIRLPKHSGLSRWLRQVTKSLQCSFLAVESVVKGAVLLFRAIVVFRSAVSRRDRAAG